MGREPKTAAENAALGMRPGFCEVHWSWACGYGHGQCHPDALTHPDPCAFGDCTAISCADGFCGPHQIDDAP